MIRDRKLVWEGCINVRDLGGLKAGDGRVTRWGAVVRSDTPSRLSAAGWSALQAHGIRTIIALRTAGMQEDAVDAAPRPTDLTTLQAPIEDISNKAFVQQWASSDLWSTPLYYIDALKCWPELHAAAVTAIARAEPGGVLIHCRRGHDRTGIMTLLLLTLVGVATEDIIADYELSIDPEREELLRAEHTTTREVLLNTLAWLDTEAYLRSGGLSQADLDAVRERLLEPDGE